jgi:hypothetical protein
MQSSADSYHLEINGIAEGPMTVRELLWKVGMTNNDDVIYFRTEGSGEWQPMEGNLERLRQLAADSADMPASPQSPPKLKLKKRGESAPPIGSDTPPPFPSEPASTEYHIETPPPLPGGPDDFSSPPQFEYTDDNPPPPPGSPGYHSAPPPLQPTAAPAPQYNPNTPPLPQSAPTPPPVGIATLLTVALVISTLVAIYVFFLMPQDVSASAKRRTESAFTREIRGLNYTILTKSEAEAWKAAALEKLSGFASKAKTEAAASTDRSLTLAVITENIITKHAAGAKALHMAAVNAHNLKNGYDAGSSSDVRSLRSLELAMEIAEPYLPSECRDDLANGRYGNVASAVRANGFSRLNSLFEEDIRTTETQLLAELAQIKPTADDAEGFAARTMYAVPSDVSSVAKGTTDTSGRFYLKLAPGDYYVIATTGPIGDMPPIEWAKGFKVRALADNILSLDDTNPGTGGSENLWKPQETAAMLRDINAIGKQAGVLSSTLNKTRKFRSDLDKLNDAIDRLLNN